MASVLEILKTLGHMGDEKKLEKANMMSVESWFSAVESSCRRLQSGILIQTILAYIRRSRMESFRTFETQIDRLYTAHRDIMNDRDVVLKKIQK